MQNRTVTAGSVYRHFKGEYYMVVAVAVHSETKRPMVVYYHLGRDPYSCARDLDMFLSDVDRVKYPDAGQDLRFEPWDMSPAGQESETPAGYRTHGSPYDLPADTPEVKPGIYRHCKGGFAQVVMLTSESETREPLVLYRLLNTGGWAVRPVTSFLGESGGKPRFAPWQFT